MPNILMAGTLRVSSKQRVTLLSLFAFCQNGMSGPTDSGSSDSPADIALLRAGVRSIWRCTLSVLLGLLLVLLLTSLALAASVGCNAVNSGLLNYTGKSQPTQTKTILLTNFFGGDRLNYTHTTSPTRAGNTLILSAGSLYQTLETTNAPTHTLTGTVGAVLGLELLNLSVTAQSNDPKSGVLLGGLLGTPTDIVVTVTCTPGPSPTALVLTSNSPTVFGQNAALTATVTATDGLTPTGNVTFTVDGVAQTPVALNGSGVATLSVPGLSTANHSVSASYAGTASFTPSNSALAFGHSVNRASTTTTVTSSTASAPVGSPITLTANVASVAPGAGIPQGSVIFSVDGFDRATVALDANGRAQTTVNAAIPNTHVVRARYLQSQDYLFSDGYLPGGQLVTKASTTIALTKSPTTATTFGQPVTFTATLTSGGGTPAGIVLFNIDGASQIATLSNGVATYTTSALAVGGHTVSVSYAGTSDLEAAEATLSGGHTVGVIPTTTTLTSSSPITFGQTATVTATVAGGTPSPSGNVVFTVDGVERPAIALDLTGKATIALTGLAGGTHAVSAAYAGATNYGASSGTLSGGVVVNKTTTATVVGTTASVTVGQPLNITAGVGAAGSLTPPDGTVTFTVGGVAQNPVTLVNGTANILVPDLPVGTYAITAAYSGGDSYLPSSGTGSGTVNKASSTLVVNSSSNPSVTGEGVTFTAIATSSFGTPSGTVTFTVDGTPGSAIALSGTGRASVTMPPKPVGNYAVSASYSGDDSHLSSSAPLPGGQTVARAATSMSLSSDIPAPALGATVTFTAQVAATAPGSGTPTGNVIFSIDGLPQAPVVLSGGSASFSRSDLGVGNHAITAFYVGDTAFVSSNGTLSGGISVSAATTNTGLTVTPTSPVYRDTATVTATVTSGGATPAGTVIFTVNSVDRPATPLVDGKAVLVLPNLAVGDYTLGARYVATTSYLASTATPRTVTVAKAGTTTGVSALPASIRLGESTTISTMVNSTQGIPTGTVEFRADDNLLGTAQLNNGAASFTTSGLTRGNHVVTVNYLGDDNFATSNGTLSGNLTVGQAATSLSVSATPLPATYGQPVTLRAEASSLSGTPTGDVVFTVGGVAQAPVALNASGVATLVVNNVQPGVQTVSASYGGDADHAAATASIIGGIAVNKAVATLAVTTSPPSPLFGTPITATATLTTPAGTIAPSGNVTFLVDGVAQTPVVPTNGVVTINLPGLGAGQHTIEARFAGDTSFLPVNATATVTLGAAATNMVLSATPGPIRFGDAVTLTANLTSSAGTPDGQVVFSIDGQPQAPATINASGIATLTTSALTVGPHAVTASYAAHGNFAGTTATLNGGVEVDVALTQTALNVQRVPVGTFTVGDTARLTATVTADHGTPNGSVVFAVDGVPRAPVTLVNGVASVDTVINSAGNHSVTASYNGGANFAPSSATLSSPISVAKANSDLQLTLAPSGEFGAILTVSAAATSSGGTPTGTVLFYVDGQQVGSGVLSSGTASLVLPQLGAGTHNVSAAYSGDNNFNADVADAASITIDPAAVTATVSATPAAPVEGQPVTFNVSVRTTTNDLLVPGTATLDIGPASYPITLVNGAGSMTLSNIPAGSYPVEVTYLANGNYGGATGLLAGGNLTIGVPPSAIQVSSNLPRAVSGLPYSGTFTAFGGTPGSAPPYTYSVTSGALPAGLTLNSNSGVISGTLGAPGTYDFQVTATDSVNATGTATAQVVVLAPATIALPASLPAATFGLDYGQSVAASGGTAPYAYIVSMGSLPQGVALNAATGALTGAPTQLGTANFEITATDANGFFASRAYTVVTGAPVITVTGSFGDATAGAPYNATVSVTGGAAPLRFSADGTLPPGLSVDATTGAVTGTPTTVGIYNFGVIATDANGFTGRLNGAIEVDAQPVIVLPSTLATPRQGRPYSQALDASGGTPPYFYAVASGSLPPGLDLNPLTGRISGTPTSSGAYTFEIRATDADQPALVGLHSYTLNVQPAATLVVTTNIGTATAGAPINKIIDVSGGTAPYTVTVVSNTLPTGVSFDPVTRQITGSTTALGTYSLMLDIADANGDTVTAVVNLNVLAPTIQVTATIDNNAFGVATSGSATASGGTSPFVYTATGLPAGVGINPVSGVISGTATEAGTFSVVVTATDFNTFTGSSDPVSFTVTPPVLTLSSLPGEFMRNRPVNRTLTVTNGTAPITFVVTGNLPDGLELDEDSGALTGTPTTEGLRSFTVTATDAFGFVATANYTVEITSDVGTSVLPASLPPVTAAVTYAGSAAATGGVAPLTYAITAGTLPDDLTFDSSTGVFGGSTLDVGPHPITVTVTDGNGRTNSRSYTLTVVAPTLSTTGSLDDAVAGTPYVDTLMATGGTGPYGFALKPGSSLPPGLVLSPTGEISGTPTAAGTFNFTVTVTDDNEFATDLVLGMTVTAPAITLTSNIPAGRIGQIYNGSISATGGAAPVTYAVTTGTLPDGLTLDTATGAIAGTPTAAGTSTVTITAKDANDFTAARSVEFVIATNMGTATLGALDTPVYGQSYSDSVVATGGTSPYLYALTAGALPTGLSLDPISGAVTGTPTVTGNFSFTVRATDHAGLINQQAYSFTIAAPEMVITVNPPSGREDELYPSTPVTITGGTAPYIYTMEDAPQGIEINPSTGVITGTPEEQGSFNPTVTVEDAHGFRVSRRFAMFIAAPPVVLNLPTSVPNGVMLTPYTASVVPDNAVGAVTYSTINLTLPPLGLTLDPNTGIISGTPLVASNYNFTVRAVDSAGNVGTANYSMLVTLLPQEVATTTTLATTATTPIIGETINVTATVTPASGSVTPTGFVALTDGLTGAPLGTSAVASDGKASFNLSFATTGPRRLEARYLGTLGFTASNGVGPTINVTAVPTTLTLSGPSGSVGTLGPHLFAANVVRNAPASGPAITGTITFSVDGVDVTSAMPALLGSATYLRLTGFSAGQHTIRARFVSPSGVEMASEDEITIEATSPTITTLSAPLEDILLGEDATFTANVTALNPGAAVTGDVIFRDSGTEVARVAVSGGTAAYTLTPSTLGIHLVTAEYVGDQYHGASAALGLSLNVTSLPPVQETSTIVLSANPTLPQVGDPLALTAKVTVPSGLVSLGTVTFVNETTGVTLGTALLNLQGEAVINLTMLDTTQTTIRANYSGSLLATPSSASIVLQPSGAATEIDLVASSAVVLPGGTVELTANVQRLGSGLVNPGTIAFLADGIAFAHVPTNGSTSATVTSNPVNGSSVAFTAQFIPGANSPDQGSTSQPVTVSTEKATPTLSANISVLSDGSATGRINVVRPSGVNRVPTGTIDLTAGTQPMQTLTLINGAANFSYPPGTFGPASTSFAFTYSGDTWFETAFDAVSVLATTQLPTQTSVSLSASQVRRTVPVTATITVTSSVAVDDGQVELFRNGALVDTLNVVNGQATYQLTNLDDGDNDITAHYLGTPNFGQSHSNTATVTVTGVAPGLLSVSLEASAVALFEAGQSITISATISADGGPADNIRIASRVLFSCPRTALDQGETMTCSGTYMVSEADMAAGGVDIAAVVSADGIADVSATLSLNAEADEISETFETMGENFVANRMRVLSNSIKLPNIFMRRTVLGGARAGTVMASGDGDSQMLAFSTSLAEWRAFSAAQAADDLAMAQPEEQLPFNIWLDSNYTIHASSDDDSWGQLGTVTLGADYMVTDDILAGVLIQGDWASETSTDGMVEGTGFLIGPYVSIALGDNLSFDATVLYGQSRNTATSTLFGDTFSGDFDTTRLLAKGELIGWFEVEDLLIRPNLAFTLGSERINDYTVTNAVGDTVSVPGGDQLQYRLTAGTDFEYEILLDDGSRITPSLGFDVGIAGGTQPDQPETTTFVGGVSVGVEYETEAGLLLGLEFSAELDSGGFSSAAIRASIKGRF